MLYLIMPSREMAWCDLPASALDLAAQHDVDLAELEWQNSERRADETTLALALRYGQRSRAGLVLSAGYVAQQDHPAEIAKAHQRVVATRATSRGNEALMERLLPGWSEHNRQLDARVDESTRESIEEAQADLQALLAQQEVDPGLVAHWITLGGRLPQS